MAKNIKNLALLRNGNLFNTREIAKQSIEAQIDNFIDGSAILGRYKGANYSEDANDVKTLVGLVYVNGANKSITIFDIENSGGGGDVDELRNEINAKLGTGVTSSNTVTTQFETLSGETFTPGVSNSADTSIAGAKEYAYELVDTLDYISGLTVNSVEITPVNNVVSISISAATSSTTAVDAGAITVETDGNGNITIGLSTIDCGDY